MTPGRVHEEVPMGERQWLDEYSGQSVDELIALEATHRIDSLVVAFEQALDQKAAREGDDALTQEEWDLLGIEALEREVNNGGYSQFFVNTPEYVPIIVQALRRIGCPRSAAITEEAIGVLQLTELSVPAIDEIMSLDDPKREDRLSACDDRYFQNTESIETQLFAFIKANRGRFRL